MKNSSRSVLRVLYWSIISSVFLAILKGIVGYYGHSYALIADGIESGSDVFSSILVLIGLRYTMRPADENHPYGHGRLEPLITFLVVGFLIVSAGVIAYESIMHIMTPHKVPAPFTLWVLGGVILLKEVNYRIVKRKGEETHSTSLKADAWHHRSDAITSLMAFIGISIALFFGKGYETADDWAALVGSGFIVYNAYLIFRPALGEIMDEQLYDEWVEKIKSSVISVKGVEGTEKCYVRKIGMYYHVDLHLLVAGDKTVTEGHDIAHLAKDHLLETFKEIRDVHIHVEPFLP